MRMPVELLINKVPQFSLGPSPVVICVPLARAPAPVIVRYFRFSKRNCVIGAPSELRRLRRPIARADVQNARSFGCAVRNQTEIFFDARPGFARRTVAVIGTGFRDEIIERFAVFDAHNAERARGQRLAAAEVFADDCRFKSGLQIGGAQSPERIARCPNRRSAQLNRFGFGRRQFRAFARRRRERIGRQNQFAVARAGDDATQLDFARAGRNCAFIIGSDVHRNGLRARRGCECSHGEQQECLNVHLLWKRKFSTERGPVILSAVRNQRSRKHPEC